MEDSQDALLDAEFDDWGDQDGGEQEENEESMHGRGPDDHAAGEGGTQPDAEDANEPGDDLDADRACARDGAMQSQSSDGWGSDVDMDAMAEELLQEVAYPGPMGAESSAAATAGPASRQQQDDAPAPGVKRRCLQPASRRGRPGRAAADAGGGPSANQAVTNDGRDGDEVGVAATLLPAPSTSEAAVAAVVGAAALGTGVAAAPSAHQPSTSVVATAAVVAKDVSASLQDSCTHPTYWAGMCVVCGAAKPEGADAADAPPPERLPSQFKRSSAAARTAGSGAPSSSGRRQPPQQQQHPHARSGAADAGAAPDPNGVTRIKHMHASAHLELTSGEAARLRRQEVSRLLAARRLVLILDLDHTLLNSVRLNDVAPEHLPALQQILDQEAGNPHRLLHCLRDKNLWTKLRPYVYEFLEAARELFELHIYTMGDKHYAAEVRRILDPGGRLFAGVISQNDSTSSAAKHLDVALVADRLVVILDDTEQVWPHHAQNLIKVERYHFFPASIRQWHAGAQSLLEQGRDESAAHGTLATCLRVLRRVHESFYDVPQQQQQQQQQGKASGADREGGAAAAGGGDGSAAAAATRDAGGTVVPLEQRDVRYYLGQQRESVLRGCVLVFSHCWPTALAAPYSHPLWRLAESLGAECSTAYDERGTTHVVAANAGTEKVSLARAAGKHVVAPDWLLACFFRWERVPEAEMPPPQHGKGGKGGGGGTGGDAGRGVMHPTDELSVALAAAGGGGGGGGLRAGADAAGNST